MHGKCICLCIGICMRTLKYAILNLIHDYTILCYVILCSFIYTYHSILYFLAILYIYIYIQCFIGYQARSGPKPSVLLRLMGSGNMTGALRLRKGTRGFSSESRCPVGTEAEGLGFIYISIYGSIYVYMYMCVCQIVEPLIYCAYVLSASLLIEHVGMYVYVYVHLYVFIYSRQPSYPHCGGLYGRLDHCTRHEGGGNRRKQRQGDATCR